MHYVVVWVKISVEKIDALNTKSVVHQVDASEKTMLAHERNG